MSDNSVFKLYENIESLVAENESRNSKIGFIV